MNAPASRRLRVWDLPTRLFHWSLAACCAGALVSADIGGNAMAWHFRFGYAILALLGFRLVWGVVGPRYARFTSFPPSPTAAWRALRERHHNDAPGHQPAGALSVYAMLALLAFQAGSGLFASDAILWDGPLKGLVSNAGSDLLTGLHKANEGLLLGLIGLHVAAIVFYRLIRRQDLIGPMIRGDADTRDADARPARDDALVRIAALVVVGGSGMLVWRLVQYGLAAAPGY